MKPKALIIGAVPPPLIGTTIFVQRLLQSPELAASLDVHLLDISDHRDGTNVGRLDGMNVILGLKHVLQCAWRLATLRPAVVYLGLSQGVPGYVRDLCFLALTVMSGRRWVAHLHGSEFRAFHARLPWLIRQLSRRLLQHASGVIVLGENLRPLFDGLVPPQVVHVIPNGVPEQPAPAPEQNEGATHRGARILHLCTLRREKGTLRLIEALPEVFEHFPDATVVFAGQWYSKRDQEAAMTILKQQGIKSRVSFVGEVSGSSKTEVFRNADVFVFPPIAPEGLPLVILEAMGAALPVVSTRQGAIPEVVLHGQTGLIVEPTPAALASAICQLIEDPERARQMGRAGFARVTAQFSERTCMGRIAALLAEVARNAQTGHPIHPGGMALAADGRH